MRFSPASQPLGAATAWSDPNAAALLYVSDPSAGAVEIYSFPYGKHLNTIGNFYQPGGMCVGKTGNVFIADQSNSTVRVYAHGGTKPLRIISDSGYTPASCAIDPVSGNLAVTSSTGLKNHGSLAIYAKAMGTPKVYYDVNIPQVYYAGYDDAGNLFLDGKTSKGAAVVGELAKGGSNIKTIPLNQAIAFPGGVQWDGKHVAIGDVDNHVIYQFAIANGKGTKAGSTPLPDASFILEFWIHGSVVVVPDFINSNVRFFKYPAGGSPNKTIPGFVGPIATAISE